MSAVENEFCSVLSCFERAFERRTEQIYAANIHVLICQMVRYVCFVYIF